MKTLGVSCKVGKHSLTFEKFPAGTEGLLRVSVGEAEPVTLRYRRDPDGVWVEFPHGTFGYDFEGEKDEQGKLQFRVTERQSHGLWNQVTLFKTGEELTQAASGAKKKASRVRAQMPGKILKVLVQMGQKVEKGQPLLVMEAMKMENEIRATLSGVIQEVKVQELTNVETGADLILIQTESAS